MFVPNLPIHQGLLSRSRLRGHAGSSEQIQWWELAWLIAMGAVAASAATFGDWSLGIPGHAILRIVFPMTLGLALVPRHGAGMVMGVSALGTTALYASAGHGAPGLGAMTSLAVFGAVLDTVLWRAHRGWLLFLGFAAAGVVTNLAALAVREGGRWAGAGPAVRGLGRGTGLGGGLGRRVAHGAARGAWLYPPISYLACGLLAGLLCAAIWFAARPRRS